MTICLHLLHQEELELELLPTPPWDEEPFEIPDVEPSVELIVPVDPTKPEDPVPVYPRDDEDVPRPLSQ
jgi:hypothetical protein